MMSPNSGLGRNLKSFCRKKPLGAWKVILEILNQTNDEVLLENLAAGPLETLIARHGRVVIGLVVERAEADERFRWLLAGVWNTGLAESIWNQIEAATVGAPEVVPENPRYSTPP